MLPVGHGRWLCFKAPGEPNGQRRLVQGHEKLDNEEVWSIGILVPGNHTVVTMNLWHLCDWKAHSGNFPQAKEAAPEVTPPPETGDQSFHMALLQHWFWDQPKLSRFWHPCQIQGYHSSLSVLTNLRGVISGRGTAATPLIWELGNWGSKLFAIWGVQMLLESLSNERQNFWK